MGCASQKWKGGTDDPEMGASWMNVMLAGRKVWSLVKLSANVGPAERSFARYPNSGIKPSQCYTYHAVLNQHQHTRVS